MNDVLQWVGVFLALFFLDFIWAEYTRAITDKRPHRAATTAVQIILLSGFATTSYVHNPILLIPAGLGAYAGTWASVKLAQRRTN